MPLRDRLTWRGLPRALRLGGLAVVGGVLAGLASAGFLVTLEAVTDLRERHDGLLLLLPVGGLVVGLATHHLAGRAARGNDLLLDEIHEPTAWVPRRMAPLVFGGTVLTHLLGGSAGREGTALQMSGSLTDGVARALHLPPEDRRLLLIAALGGGFGSVFGVPLAGAVFALEVQWVRGLRRDAALLALLSSTVGHLVVVGLGVHHTPTPTLAGIGITAGLLGKVALAGVAFGVVAAAFAELTHRLRDLAARCIAWPPLRPVVGGGLVVLATLALGTRAYLGLSIPLATAALAGGGGVAGGAFLAKLLCTAVTLGSGFPGGEVTPLFVIGATLGTTLAGPLHLPVGLLAALGFVAVFAGAAKVPLACTVMGVELFGPGVVVPLAVACGVSYLASGRRGIYRAQRPAPVPRPT